MKHITRATYVTFHAKLFIFVIIAKTKTRDIMAFPVFIRLLECSIYKNYQRNFVENLGLSDINTIMRNILHPGSTTKMNSCISWSTSVLITKLFHSSFSCPYHFKFVWTDTSSKFINTVTYHCTEMLTLKLSLSQHAKCSTRPRNYYFLIECSIVLYWERKMVASKQ